MKYQEYEDLDVHGRAVRMLSNYIPQVLWKEGHVTLTDWQRLGY